MLTKYERSSSLVNDYDLLVGQHVFQRSERFVSFTNISIYFNTIKRLIGAAKGRLHLARHNRHPIGHYICLDLTSFTTELPPSLHVNN
jgi:hypothetical protein